jgi:hypothetical protein
MKIDENHPLDHTHQRSVVVRRKLMSWYDYVKEGIARWEPRDCPDNWH